MNHSMNQKMVQLLLFAASLMVSFPVDAGIKLLASQKAKITQEQLERLEKLIESGCLENNKTQCGAKRCLIDQDPKACYQSAMSKRTFEDRIQDQKNSCDAGNKFACGVYCGLLETKTPFCVQFIENSK